MFLNTYSIIMNRFISLFTVVTVLFIAIFLQAGSNASYAQGSYWTDINVRSDEGSPTIQPSVYRTVGIDIETIRQVLDSAPLEKDASARNSSAIIELPMPDGTMELFSFVNSPVMAPELASKYPEIQVYLGQGIDNPSSVVRFDLTPQGFHAMILRSESTVYIDPFTAGDLTKCISYTKNSFYESTDKQLEGCVVKEGHLGEVTPKSFNAVQTPESVKSKPEVLQMGIQKSMMVSNGSTLRTYRFALACTGEYAQYHGGTVAGVLAAMNTSMARVNGVFERDVCIRMVIVANNENVIFLNSGSDPYSNGMGAQCSVKTKALVTVKLVQTTMTSVTFFQLVEEVLPTYNLLVAVTKREVSQAKTHLSTIPLISIMLLTKWGINGEGITLKTTVATGQVAQLMSPGRLLQLWVTRGYAHRIFNQILMTIFTITASTK